MTEPRATLLHEALTHFAGLSGSAPLLIAPRATHTYAEVEAETNRLARLLVRLDVHRGDRVALLAKNGLTYVAGFFAIQRAGATVVPINHSTDGPGLRYLLDNCGARGLIAEAAFASVVEAAWALPAATGSFLVVDEPEAFAYARSQVVSWAETASESATPPDPLAGPDDRAAIIYTSGSTGRPRGAVLSHRALAANTRSIVQYLGLTSSDRMMTVLPFFYVYGQSLLNTHVWVGGSLAIGVDLLFPNDVIKRIKRDEATGLAGVPSTFAILLHRSKLAEEPMPSLRYVTQAGGAMAPDLIRRLVAAVPKAKVFVMYGATEAGARLTYLEPGELPRKLGSIGKAIPDVDVRVLREDGSETAVDEVGEIVARGENIMSGYWDAPEETAAVLDEHGFHTGDLGRRDAEGFLYVVGRKREMIKCGANRISPLEVEEVLLEHPAVHEAAVIGVPHELLGEAIVAFVAFRPGSGGEELESLRNFAASRLPEYKNPGHIRIWPELPKSGAGKIQKDVLRQAWRDREGEP